MTKGKAGLDREAEEKATALQSSLKVNFTSDGKTVNVQPGTTLLEAARQADFHINASCNGKGACGKCKLVVTAGKTQNPSFPAERYAEGERIYFGLPKQGGGRCYR